MILCATIPGDPVSWRRNRATVRRGKVHTYRPRSGPDQQWREEAAELLRETAQGIGWTRLEGPVGVVVRFVYPRPQRTPKRETGLAWRPTRNRDDLDRLVTNLFDALVGAGLLVDDGQVCALRAEKLRAEAGEGARVEIEVHPLSPRRP